jgi:hypothetical protein
MTISLTFCGRAPWRYDPTVILGATKGWTLRLTGNGEITFAEGVGGIRRPEYGFFFEIDDGFIGQGSYTAQWDDVGVGECPLFEPDCECSIVDSICLATGPIESHGLESGRIRFLHTGAFPPS